MPDPIRRRTLTPTSISIHPSRPCRRRYDAFGNRPRHAPRGDQPMEQRKFGKTDMTVSVLGFGGAEIGFEGASDDTVERLLGDALDAGLNVIDTAECYMDSEEKIGKAVAHRRGDFHLFTKCGHPETPGG